MNVCKWLQAAVNIQDVINNVLIVLNNILLQKFSVKWRGFVYKVCENHLFCVVMKHKSCFDVV